MSEQEEELQAEVPDTGAVEETTDSDLIRKLTIRIGIVCLALFAWYIAADRLTPNTSQARVRGNVVPIAPQVAGFVTEVKVTMNQIVLDDQLLLKIDPDNYELAVKQAQADLEKAGQTVGATTADVGFAQANLVEAMARLRSTEAQAGRIIAIEETGVVTEAEVDKARADIAGARARVSEAESQLERARENLGVEGSENPSIVAAMARLEKAQLDLARSSLYAPGMGVVSNVRVHEGYFANVGQPLMTFISGENLWIEAYMRENNMANIDPEDEVEFVLDSMPGVVHQARVSSLGFGIADSSNSQVGQLSTAEQKTGWLRDPQRFPVIITIPRESTRGHVREGGQADVMVYTGGNWVMNSIGWLYIRVIAYLSYLY
jgi:multidrug resistance efflux pump